jgi:hypothetical protein
MSTTDAEKRKLLIDQALAGKDYAMANKLEAGNSFLGVNNDSPDAPMKKAELLRTMGLADEKVKTLVNKQDPFADLQKAHDAKLKELELGLGKMKRNTDEEKKAYDDARAKIGEFKATHEEQVNTLRKETLAAYFGEPSTSGGSSESGSPSGGNGASPSPSSPSSSGPKGSTSGAAEPDYQTPAFIRNPGTSRGAQTVHGAEARTMSPAEIEAIKTKLKTEDFAGKMKEKKGSAGATV